MSNNTPENKVKEKIRDYLESLKPKMFYFSVPASPLGRAGVADIICSFNGEFIAIELKSEEAYMRLGHNMSVAQMLFRNLVEESGGIYMCICNVSMLKEQMLRNFPDELRDRVLTKNRLSLQG